MERVAEPQPERPQPEQPPEMRVGDRERREVDTRLRQAYDDGVLTLSEYDERAALCWAARTQRDLDALTRDLPDPRPAPPEPEEDRVQAGTGHPPRRHLGRLALLGAAVLFGGQIVTAPDAVAIFSGQVVQVGSDQDRVEVGVLFGNVEVVVPDDARVDTSGVLLFGGTDCAAACGGTGTQPITVDAVGGFGSVDVVRQSERLLRDVDRDG
jgi:Domain of unknown function (DUF1707)